MKHNSSTGSSTNLNLVSGWLYDCANYHEHCCHKPQIKSILPHRVLDLRDWESARKIFLSVGEDRIGSYAALSYCWGKAESKPKYLTINENLKQQQKAVDIITLPKTFTDAIVVCQHLGIRFLWIDSICIIQNDKSDWQTQSARMGDIYSNAALTISAATGEDSHSGLFFDRDPRKTYPCTLTLQYPDEDGVIRKRAFLTCQDQYWPKTAHLDTRGWTFQEKYLSPRTLHFYETEMSWACASSIASEGLPMGLQPMTNKSDFDKYIKVDINGSLPTQIDMVQRYHWWYQTIEIYSHRNFTFESDRLMALAGLASAFQHSEDEFLYGLWKSDLVHGLAWRFDGQHKEIAAEASSTSPIPTWSWASRPGSIITYSDSHLPPGTFMEVNESITSYDIPEGSLKHAFIEVLSVEPMHQATNSSSLSTFTSRSLRLRGLVIRISLAKSSMAYNSSSWSTNTSMTLFQNAFALNNRKCKQFRGDVFYDEPVTKGDNLYCLPLSVLPLARHKVSSRPNDANAQTQRPLGDIAIDKLVSKQKLSLELEGCTLPTMTWCAGLISCCRLERKDTLSCLLLKKVDAEEMKFRRVGYVEIMDGRLFEGLAPVTLEIR
jgi:hypothetical protein